jgi:hypothetical protein
MIVLEDNPSTIDLLFYKAPFVSPLIARDSEIASN